MNLRTMCSSIVTAGAAILITGCAVEPATETAAQELGGPLSATPRAIDLGALPLRTETRTEITLANGGRSDVEILRLAIIPPDPYVPPDPCHLSLIATCVRPGDSTSVTLACTPEAAGVLAFDVLVSYRVGELDYELAIPVDGTAR